MELKFRAYNKTDKVMIFNLNSPRLIDGVLTGDDDDILMQFTGLQDKNGVDIYAGDICRVDGLGNCVVDICCYYGAQFNDYKGNHSPVIDSDAEQDQYKVIGNIHQHPELMEK